MRRITASALGLAASLGLVFSAVPASGDEEDQVRWSLSPILQYHFIESPEDDDDVTGFFDQYEFVPNKSSAFPVQLGVRDAAFDWFGEGQTPILQIRLDSPTSNLGLSGSDIEDPFFDQRALILGRFQPLDFDLRYWRMRTEALRLFPNTAEGARVFEDLTDPNDRFARERTGFFSEIRSSVTDLVGDRASVVDALAPKLSLRGGYESREGMQQRRFLVEPSNRWIGVSQERDQQVGKVGGGLLLAPWRLLTLSVDVDHERFREDASPLLRSAFVGGPPNDGTIGFVPDTDRLTGRALLRSRLGERAVVEGGFQASLLEQVDDFAPQQRSAGLNDNRVIHLSGNLAADIAVLDAFSVNASFGFEQRDNDIERNTSLFNATNGTQSGVFVDQWTRWRGTVEGVYRIDAGKRIAIGGRYESVDRQLDFSQPGLVRVLPVNTLVSDDSESYTIYGQTHLRLLRRINLTGEIGYQLAPETGYLTDLDDHLYGKLRASYALPVESAVVLSLFARGGSGESDEQVLVSGVGENPAGPSVRRRFDRTEWLWGLTASAAPSQKVGVFASFFMSRDMQDYELVLSDLQRYFQPVAPVAFSEGGRTDYQDDRINVMLGTHVQLCEPTDAALSYSFTRAETDYDAGGSAQLALVSRYRGIDADIHGIDLELGHQLRDGLRVRAGYGFQYYDDRSRLPVSAGSVVAPFDLGTTRHSVTLGVTLTSALLDD